MLEVGDMCFFFFQAEDGIREGKECGELGNGYRVKEKLLDTMGGCQQSIG